MSVQPPAAGGDYPLASPASWVSQNVVATVAVADTAAATVQHVSPISLPVQRIGCHEGTATITPIRPEALRRRIHSA